jgi:hypothetical protein
MSTVQLDKIQDGVNLTDIKEKMFHILLTCMTQGENANVLIAKWIELWGEFRKVAKRQNLQMILLKVEFLKLFSRNGFA